MTPPSPLTADDHRIIDDLMLVLEWHHGEGNEISAECLLVTMQARGHDLPGLPTLRDFVHKARLARCVICSNDRGYFVPVTLNEVEATVQRLRHPAGDMMHTARVLRQSGREQLGGQLRLI